VAFPRGISSVLLLPPALAAQEPFPLEPITVTAHRIPVPLEETATSIEVVTEEQIRQKQAISVLDLLRDLPGVDLVQTGGPGKLTSIFLRGTNSNHVLVLIDGVEVNDPSAPAGGFDFAHLTVDNIERIEILKGPQSTLYGSEAIGGVIQIFTKRGVGKPKFYLSGEGGKFATFRLGGGVSGSTETLSYSFSGGYWHTDGFSAAKGDRPGNGEDDGYQNVVVSGRLGWRPLQRFGLDLSVRYHHGETEIDDCGGPFCDDPDHEQLTDQLAVQGTVRFEPLSLWESRLRLGYSLTDRKIRDPQDGKSPFDFGDQRFRYRGEKFKVDWQNHLPLLDGEQNRFALLFGLTEEIEQSEDKERKERANSFGLYGESRLKLFGRSVTTAGARFDHHGRIDDDSVTWRVTQAVLFPETGTKLRATFGTAFRAPSLFQLFGPHFGNPDLDPERSFGFDAGIDQNLGPFLFQTSYFKNRLRDLIDFTPRGYRNVERAVASGVEASVVWTPLEAFRIRASYTFTDTEEKTTGRSLLRRPRHKGRIDLDYRLERFTLHLDLHLVGARDDLFFDNATFQSRRVKLDPYLLVNLALRYRLNGIVELFGRIENLTDRDYQEVFGFGTSPVAGFAGMRLSF